MVQVISYRCNRSGTLFKLPRWMRLLESSSRNYNSTPALRRNEVQMGQRMSLQPTFHVRALWTGQRVCVDLVEESNGLQVDGAACSRRLPCRRGLIALPTTAWAILTRLHL